MGVKRDADAMHVHIDEIVIDNVHAERIERALANVLVTEHGVDTCVAGQVARHVSRQIGGNDGNAQ